MAPHESDFRAPAAASRSLLWGRCEPPPNLPPTACQAAVCAGDENSRASQQTPDCLTQGGSVNSAAHPGGAAAVWLHKGGRSEASGLWCSVVGADLPRRVCEGFAPVCHVESPFWSRSPTRVGNRRWQWRDPFDRPLPWKQILNKEEERKGGKWKWNN